ncbi:MAG TPA: IPT/TIG domain-containing protein [Candidatus Saccharimonadales bacterium]|jgi:hypothetical protein
MKYKKISEIISHLQSMRFHKAFGFALAFLVVGSMAALGANHVNDSSAATGGTLYVSPASSSVTSGSNFTVAVRATSGTNAINAVQASLTYNPSQLQFVSVSEGTAFPTVAATNTATAGIIRIARGTAPNTTVTGDQVVVSVTFKVLAASGTTSVAFDAPFSNIALAADGTNMLSSTTGGTYTVQGTGSTSNTLYIAPATGNQAAGSTFTVAVHENSNTNPINAAQASLTYNASQLQFVSITESASFPTVAATSTSTPGLIRVARGTASNTSVTGDKTLFSVTFRVLATSGTTSLAIDPAFSNIALTADGSNILSTTAGATYTVQSASSGSASLSLTPASGTFEQNSTVSVVIKATSATARLLTIQSVLNYPASQLQYLSTTEGSVFTTAQRTNTSTSGVIDLIRNIPGGGTGVTGTNDVVTVNFRVIGSSGTAAINFASTSGIYDDSGTGANVLGGTTGANYSLGSVAAPAPAVSSISPTSGSTAGGTTVTINGSNFISGATVSFGGTAASNVVYVSSTQMRANAPARTAGGAGVRVTNPDGQSNSNQPTFTYVAPAPSISVVAPTAGPTAGGTIITITGTNFVNGATVTVDGATASSVVFVSSTTMRATTPAHSAGSASVTVRNPDSQSATRSSAFNYLMPGDANNDGRVNAIDLSILVTHDSENYPAADFNGDGTVGSADLAILIGNWTW